jgi:prevent-host-death family protein
MAQVGMFEAKTHFSELAKRVQAGEEIIVTNRGEPVLKMVPVEAPYDPEEARQAVQRIRERARRINLNWTPDEIKAAINDGRR